MTLWCGCALGKSVNLTEKLNSELHDAILKDSPHAELADLVYQGAEINNRRDSGWTPLMFAALACSDKETINSILALGGDRTLTDEDGKTAYTIALESDECPESLSLLQ